MCRTGVQIEGGIKMDEERFIRLAEILVDSEGIPEIKYNTRIATTLIKTQEN